ncbi:MAG: hypothetical protein ACK5Z2_07945 [Bacteroidota bacterium]
MKTALQLIVFIAAFVFTSCQPAQDASAQNLPGNKSGINADTLVANSIRLYVYPLPENGFPALTQIRPLKTDTTILLCAAAAFTRLDNGNVDGLFAVNGVLNGTVSKRLGGGCIISDQQPFVKMFATRDATLLTKGWVDSAIVSKKVSFFQQLQLVRDSLPLRYGKDISLFQRRALVTFTNSSRKPAVIESAAEITLQQFADALSQLAVKDAIYLDMGGWDEGWIRTTDGKRKTIGLIRSQTARQCNWLVFKKVS